MMTNLSFWYPEGIAKSTLNNRTRLIDIPLAQRSDLKLASSLLSVENGQKVVNAALESYGKLHEVINNTGIFPMKAYTV
ncbi:hypothetical protein KEM48_013552 [Puccinia striiformis f. sp. tritici PST-130]|nr:hypothetical protein KEM48_013552 [Puccinia striiformis f. sp. tritici PST-130]